MEIHMYIQYVYHLSSTCTDSNKESITCEHVCIQPCYACTCKIHVRQIHVHVTSSIQGVVSAV